MSFTRFRALLHLLLIRRVGSARERPLPEAKLSVTESVVEVTDEAPSSDPLENLARQGKLRWNDNLMPQTCCFSCVLARRGLPSVASKDALKDLSEGTSQFTREPAEYPWAYNRTKSRVQSVHLPRLLPVTPASVLTLGGRVVEVTNNCRASSCTMFLFHVVEAMLTPPPRRGGRVGLYALSLLFLDWL